MSYYIFACSDGYFCKRQYKKICFNHKNDLAIEKKGENVMYKINYSPQQLVQRPSSPATFADVKSISKDFCTIAVSIYLHASLK